eukprot:NODE_883_length_3330_cov_0.555246.p1 type:complete len:316 gc:universal NODE_883_length_3330_cov_0.555246:786-1733(+)
MVTQSPSTRLSTGQQMPLVGLGTWNLQNAQQHVLEALQMGYRLIDSAWINDNEKQVGMAIDQALNENMVKRSDLFVVSKLWNTFHRRGLIEQGFRESLNALRVDYLDLYLMHWPIAMDPKMGKQFKFDGSDRVELDSQGLSVLDTWREMEMLVQSGKCKSIGVANVNLQQLREIVQNGKIKPSVLQMELHPFYYNQVLLDYCKQENIVVMAYMPLHDQISEMQSSTQVDFLRNPVIQSVAQKENMTPAQILLLWHLTENRVVIPKASHSQLIKENFIFLTKMQKLPVEDFKKIQMLTREKQIRTVDPQKLFNVKI